MTDARIGEAPALLDEASGKLLVGNAWLPGNGVSSVTKLGSQ